jgi:hypothetical protein
MGTKVAAIKTPVSVHDMGIALSVAWTKLWGDIPTYKSILILQAHYALETGDGQSLVCFNVGNKRTGKGYTGDYCTFMTWEIEHGQRVNQLGDFRAYPDLTAGCVDYLKGLKNGNFAKAWPLVLAGDPREFAIKLKEAHYYTAPLADYIKAMESRFYGIAGKGKLTTQDELIAALISVGYSDVKSYQAARGLTVDGIAGPMTKGMLALEVGA